MSKFIEQSNVSLAWLEAMEYLIDQRGTASNLIVAVGPGIEENNRIRSHFDAFLEEHESDEVRRIAKVADTIFPSDIYNPSSPSSLQDLLDRQSYARLVEAPYLRRGNYFHRITDWTDRKGKRIIQLERIINRLRRHRTKKNRQNGSAYEIAVSLIDDDDVRDEECSGDLRVFDPERDFVERGFPCLSHMSLTLHHGCVDLTALYRSQHFISKAYGNFLGLLGLLDMICHETDYKAGQLVCVATHASAELSGPWKQDILTLVERARASTLPDIASIDLQPTFAF